MSKIEKSSGNKIKLFAAAVFIMMAIGAFSFPAYAQSADDPGIAPAVTKAIIEAKGLAKIHDIQYPLATLPEIVEDGSLFTIELSSNPGTAKWIVIKMSPTFSEFKSENSFVTEALYVSGPAPSKFWVGECEKQVYTITAQMSTFEEEPKLAECMYDIEVSWGKGSDSQPHAIKIVDEIKSNYTYAVIMDFHTGDPRLMANEMSPEGFQKNWGEYWSLGLQNQLIKEINAINPEFVLLGGDNVFGQMMPEEYGSSASVPYEAGNGQNYTMGDEYNTVYNLMLKCEVPAFFALGNHDGYIQGADDGYEYWKAMIGPMYYSFDYGTTHFVSLNTYDWNQLDRQGISLGVTAWGGQVREQEMEWLKCDLASNTANDIVILAHHTPSWPMEYGYGKNYTEGIPVVEQMDRIFESYAIYGDEKWTGEGHDELLGLCQKYNVSAFYAGHVHWDEVNITNWGSHETKFIVTTAVSSNSNQYLGYRLIDVKSGAMANYGYDLSADERQQYFGDPNAHVGEQTYSVPICKLNVSIEEQGSPGRSSVATIQNDLNCAFEGVKVRLKIVANTNTKNHLAVGGDLKGSISNIFEGPSGLEAEVLADVSAHSKGTVYLIDESINGKAGENAIIPGFEMLFAGLALAFTAFLAKKR
ncbi:MAG: metallophosphoesterase [Candidatus Thermoplasmatota archaeon]|nr:metallophosphoesterase [Candidatus Thermoplasmatota archaeon]